MFTTFGQQAIEAVSLPSVRRGGPAARTHFCGRRLTLERLESRTLLSFLAPVNYETGHSASSVVVADLNGDQKLDLVTGSVDGTVSVLLGNGDGTFQGPRSYVAGDTVSSVAVGDFDGDGKLDLVSVIPGPGIGTPGDMSLLLGNGDGTFQPARHFSLGIDPGHVAVADVNQDGNLDLVVGFDGARGDLHGSVAVLLGNGDGTFRTGWTYDTGLNSSPIPTVADFNGDGKLDLAIVDYGRVSVLLGNGDGTFGAPQTYTVGTNPSSVAVGDLNGDGRPDIVVANSALRSGSPFVSVLLGNGDGTFQAARNYDAGQGPVSVALDDFNGDGRPDIVVANYVHDTVSVLLGNGDGTFGPPQSYDSGSYAVAVGDFNGDGRPDLATVGGGPGVLVLLGNGDGTFPTLPKYDTGLNIGPGATPAMIVGDFNGDGIPDLALAYAGTVSVLLGNGDGSFQAPRISSFVGYGPVTSLAVGDFNGDGRLDLVVASLGDHPHTGGVTLLLGNGDGSFQTSFSYRRSELAGPPISVAVGDFNEDKRLDLIVSNLNGDGTLSVFLGNGNGTFRSPQDYVLGPRYITVAVADLNGDGHLDIVTENTSSSFQGSVSVLLGNGDGSFQSPRTFALSQRAFALEIGDLNGDGIPDLVLGNGLNGETKGGVTVFLGNGDGTFQPGVDYFTGYDVETMALADFNQDGRLDLAVGIGAAGVLLGNGDGSFQATSLSYGTRASVGAVADLRGDGFPDVVTPNRFSHTISVLLNAADWPSGPGGSSPGPSRSSPRRSGLRSADPLELAATERLPRTYADLAGQPSPAAGFASAGLVQPRLTAAGSDRFFAASTQGPRRLTHPRPEPVTGNGVYAWLEGLAQIDTALFPALLGAAP